MTDRYALTVRNYERAAAAGLVDAEWYRTPIDRTELLRLTQRSNVRPIFDATLWIALVAVFGTFGALLWPSPWAAIPLFFYGALYGGSSDARWHEYGHGTAFKADWLNETLFMVASFMLLRPPTYSRWTHARHHSDTLIVGRDPEISLTRPPDLLRLGLNLFNLPGGLATGRLAVRHARGRFDHRDRDLVPIEHLDRLVVEARVGLGILMAVVVTTLGTGSILPVLLIGLPTFYGAWLKILFNTTQHGGLPEDELDHRVVARTMELNPISRFLYLNMNYHIEHHMYPAVPYHRLPALRSAVEADLPPAKGLLATYREMLPVLWRQRSDPTLVIHQPIPTEGSPGGIRTATRPPAPEADPITAGRWSQVCSTDDLPPESTVRYDDSTRSYVVWRNEAGLVAAIDGFCTHNPSTHLSEGVVVGDCIECPKHNGRFDRQGNVTKPPPIKAATSYPVKIEDGSVWIDVGAGSLQEPDGTGVSRSKSGK